LKNIFRIKYWFVFLRKYGVIIRRPLEQEHVNAKIYLLEKCILRKYSISQNHPNLD